MAIIKLVFQFRVVFKDISQKFENLSFSKCIKNLVNIANAITSLLHTDYLKTVEKLNMHR